MKENIMVRLSEVFSNVSLDDDKFFNNVYEEINGEFVLCELDEGALMCGVIETDIIPIEYSDVFGKYQAIAIKDIINSNLSLYKKLFSKNVRKIVISYNDLMFDGIFVVKNDTFFEIDEFCFLHKLISRGSCLNSREISKYVRAYLIDKNMNPKSDYENSSFEEKVMHYCRLKNNYETLYNVLYYYDEEDKNDVLLEMNEFFENYYIFDIMNNELNDYCKDVRENNPYIFNNIDSFMKILNKYSNDILKISKDDINFDKYMSKKEILSNVYKVLEFIDPSLTLLNEFITNVDNETIIIWEKSKPRDYNKYKKNNPYLLDEDTEWYTMRIGNKIIVNNPLDNNIVDVMSIIHEFIHFHSTNMTKLKLNENFKEFTAIFFETIAGNVLKDNGYDVEEVEKLNKWRLYHITSNLYSLSSLFKVISFSRNNIAINEDNIMSCEEIETLLSVLRFKGLTVENESVLKEKIFELKKIYAVNLRKRILSLSSDTYMGFSYILGKLLTDEILKDGDERIKINSVIDVMDMIANPNVLNSEIFEKIGLSSTELGFFDERSEVKNKVKSLIKEK